MEVDHWVTYDRMAGTYPSDPILNLAGYSRAEIAIVTRTTERIT